MKKLFAILAITAIAISACKKDSEEEVKVNVLVPTVGNVSVTSVTSDSATFSATVTLQGETPVTARGFCWGKTQNPDLTGTFNVSGSGLGAYTTRIGGLKDSTIYYVRSYATNSAGTSYGQEVPFTTLAFQGATSLIVEQKNRGILLDFSETWCPPCGAYGGPAFDSILFQEGTLLTAMKIYGSSSPSSLNSSVSNSFSSAYGVSGVPDFWFNNTEENVGGGVYSSVSANYNWAVGKANTFAASSVKAGVAVRKEVVNDSIVISTKVKFFQAQTAGQNFKIAAYVVEDDIIATQQVSNAPANTAYVHRNLLRACNNTSSYGGVALNSSSAITVNQEFPNTFKIKVNPAWNMAKVKVICVVWNGNSTPHIVVNSNLAQ